MSFWDFVLYLLNYSKVKKLMKVKKESSLGYLLAYESCLAGLFGSWLNVPHFG
jgi:hypothetical protein